MPITLYRNLCKKWQTKIIRSGSKIHLIPLCVSNLLAMDFGLCEWGFIIVLWDIRKAT